MARKDWPITEAWDEFVRGTDYKSRIALYKTVDENVRFFEGDQWTGVSAPNLPTPVFNIIKPAGKFMAVHIKDRKLALQFGAEGGREDIRELLKQMTDYGKRTWDRLNMEYKNLEGLTDAFTTGDYILYHWWNTDIETGQPFRGDIDSMRIDNVNYYPGNPNVSDVQSQPYHTGFPRAGRKRAQGRGAEQDFARGRRAHRGRRGYGIYGGRHGQDRAG